ncbi:MAG: thioredoxin family protein [Phycisphaerales bacterium]|jgi:thiol:disulfide interchange protein
MHTANTPATMISTRPGRAIGSIIFTVAILIAAGLLLARMGMGGGQAEAAPEFMPVTTDLSSVVLSGDQPVVAVVTADWCGPCQELKRTTLSDERVRSLLANRSQPVIIDGTDTKIAMPTLEQLGVRAFPSTVVLEDGKPVAMLEGYASADKYLAWLEQQL